MRKVTILALAFVAPLAAAIPANALETSRTYQVSFDGQQVGTWRLRQRVVDTGSTCRYTVQWRDLSGPPLTRTTLCRIDEYKAGDNFDCEEARYSAFDTLVQKAPGTCQGFDDYGQQTNVQTLVGGEDSGGSINGVVLTDSVGDVQNLQID